ncbi:MAG: HAMP domain-containing sensor histidine kinase [Candidatus Liptonbacteria bacterium]|nr:HAMP domain-containing sensor histidine kinase [Candidatus Liptonbacteria bacterium]
MMDNANGEQIKVGGDSAELNKELQDARTKLEEMNHFKNHLLSLTSHELRTPLAVIKGYATVLKEGLYGEVNEKTRETLEKIEFAADDLVNLVNNIIDLRKVEEGRMEYNFERVDFRELAEDVFEGMRLIAVHKGLELAFTAPSHEIPVKADAQKLRHSIQNLVDNAVKYTPSGFVRAEIKEDGSRVIFSVKDSGIGIAPGVKPLLFEEFVRDERVKQEIRGTGIGLHIAKNFVLAHGGKIWCESEGEGKGSTFFIELPRAA